MNQSSFIDEPRGLRSLAFDSPIGHLRLVFRDDAVVGLYLPQHKGAPALGETPERADVADHSIPRRVRAQLDEYFAGRRAVFDIPLCLAGTDFQREVWGALLRIPLGQTRCYADLAKQLGRPRAVRAVGAANARNPVSILVPCHRVIGKDGTLVGYAGGTERKRWLLQHEQGMRAGVAPLLLPWKSPLP